MKGKTKLFVMLFLFFVLMGGKQVQGKSLDEMPTIGKITDSYWFIDARYKIPADNGFNMVRTDQTTIQKLSGTLAGDKLQVGDSSKQSSVLIRNVGKFRGKNVNVKITLEMLRQSGTDLELSTTNFLDLTTYANGKAKLTYEFLDDNLAPMPVKTTFNFAGLNDWKNLVILSATDKVEKLSGFSDTTTIFEYSKLDNLLKLSGNARSYLNSWDSNSAKLAVLTKRITKMEYIVENKDSNNRSSLHYLTSFINAIALFHELQPLEIPKQQIEVVNYLGMYRTVKAVYDLYVPELSPDKYPGNYKLDITLKNRDQQFKAARLFVKDQDGIDRTDWFDYGFGISASMFNINVNPDVLKNPEFYGKTYYFTLISNFVGDDGRPPVDRYDLYDPFTYRLDYENKTYVMPASGRNLLLVPAFAYSNSTLIDYKGQVVVNYVDEKNQPLLPSKTIEGLYSTPFDVSGEYPQIDGYFPLKEKPEQDKGIFAPPSPQVITHRYRKIGPLLLELKNQEDPLVFSRTTKKKVLDVHMSYNVDQAVSLVAKAENKRVVIKVYDSIAPSLEESVEAQLPESWFGKEVSFVLESRGQRSNVVKRKVVLDDVPKLALPNQISFGTVEVPASNRSVYAGNTKDIQVEGQHQVENKPWKVYVKAEQPLTNSAGAQLAPLTFENAKQKITINQEEQLVWQGSGTASFEPDHRIALNLKPTDQPGNYSTQLIWILRNAPA